ncbi:hypothetical protein D3C79_827750 [compost metagenome]
MLAIGGGQIPNLRFDSLDGVFVVHAFVTTFRMVPGTTILRMQNTSKLVVLDSLLSGRKLVNLTCRFVERCSWLLFRYWHPLNNFADKMISFTCGSNNISPRHTCQVQLHDLLDASVIICSLVGVKSFGSCGVLDFHCGSSFFRFSS